MPIFVTADAMLRHADAMLILRRYAAFFDADCHAFLSFFSLIFFLRHFDYFFAVFAFDYISPLILHTLLFFSLFFFSIFIAASFRIRQSQCLMSRMSLPTIRHADDAAAAFDFLRRCRHFADAFIIIIADAFDVFAFAAFRLRLYIATLSLSIRFSADADVDYFADIFLLAAFFFDAARRHRPVTPPLRYAARYFAFATSIIAAIITPCCRLPPPLMPPCHTCPPLPYCRHFCHCWCRLRAIFITTIAFFLYTFSLSYFWFRRYFRCLFRRQYFLLIDFRCFSLLPLFSRCFSSLIFSLSLYFRCWLFSFLSFSFSLSFRWLLISPIIAGFPFVIFILRFCFRFSFRCFFLRLSLSFFSLFRV